MPNANGAAAPGLARARWSRVAIVVTALALAAWGARVLAPDTGNGAGFNSDSAIPLLMANAEKLTPYHLYYFAQDRFGGWPFIVAWLLRALTGVSWSVLGLYAALSGALLAGLVALRRLAAGWESYAVAAGVLALFLDERARHAIFDMAQPYGWQLATLLGGWGALRSWHERGGQKALWGAGALFSFSAWMSPLSGLLALVIAAGEAAGRGLEPKALGRAVLPAIVAAIADPIIKGRYHVYCIRHHLWYQPTNTAIDWGHLGDDIGAVASVLARGSGELEAVLALVAMVAALRLARRPGAERIGALARTAVIATVGGLVCAATCSVAMWIRFNRYADRYLAPAHFFLGLAAILSVPLVVQLLGARTTAAIEVGGAAVLLLVAGARLPLLQEDPGYALTLETARRLEAVAPDEPLLGEYWGLDVFVGAQREHPLRPVCYQTLERTPWNLRSLLDASEITVSQVGTPVFGKPDSPTPLLELSGALFQLEQPRWLVVGSNTFARYRRTMGTAGPPIRASFNDVAPIELPARQGLVKRRLHAGLWPPLTLDFPPRTGFRLLVGLGATLSHHEVDHLVWRALSPDGTLREVGVHVSRSDFLVSVDVDASGPPVSRVELAEAPPNLYLTNAFWAEPAPPG